MLLQDKCTFCQAQFHRGERLVWIFNKAHHQKCADYVLDNKKDDPKRVEGESR